MQMRSQFINLRMLRLRRAHANFLMPYDVNNDLRLVLHRDLHRKQDNSKSTATESQKRLSIWRNVSLDSQSVIWIQFDYKSLLHCLLRIDICIEKSLCKCLLTYIVHFSSSQEKEGKSNWKKNRKNRMCSVVAQHDLLFIASSGSLVWLTGSTFNLQHLSLLRHVKTINFEAQKQWRSLQVNIFYKTEAEASSKVE